MSLLSIPLYYGSESKYGTQASNFPANVADCFDEVWLEMQGKDDLFSALQTQIERAKEYIDRAVVLETKGIDGASKLTKRIRAELKFLNGVD